MEFYEKKPLDMRKHLDEYEDYQKSLPNYVDKKDLISFMEGFLSNIGFHKRLQPVRELGQVFLPFLDPYWTRAGRVYISEEDLSRTKLMTLRMKIADCLREASRRGELPHLVDYSKDPNLKNWLLLRG